MRILLIEDDPMIGKALVRGLSDQGMTVDWVRNGAEGSAALACAEHALVLLDIGLPEMSGIEVLKAARTAGALVPVLVITARDSLDDRIAGLDLGADDYIVKPFELRELFARMRAVLRRHNGQAQSLIMSGEIEEVESNAVDFLIHEIRKKFDKDIIRNVRGAGWMVVKSET